jgi:hypothetical protein
MREILIFRNSLFDAIFTHILTNLVQRVSAKSHSAKCHLIVPKIVTEMFLVIAPSIFGLHVWFFSRVCKVSKKLFQSTFENKNDFAREKVEIR